MCERILPVRASFVNIIYLQIWLWKPVSFYCGIKVITMTIMHKLIGHLSENQTGSLWLPYSWHQTWLILRTQIGDFLHGGKYNETWDQDLNYNRLYTDSLYSHQRRQLFHSLFWRNTFLKPDRFLTCVKLVFEKLTFAHVTDINISGPKNRLVSSYGFRNSFICFILLKACKYPAINGKVF